MIKDIQNSWNDEFSRGVLLVTATVLGIVLPLDFLAQIDGYLMYLRPRELLPVWGWAWLLYFSWGLIFGTIALSVIAGLTAVFQRKLVAVAVRAGSWWMSISVVVMDLIRTGKLWLATHGFAGVATWLTEHQFALTVAILLSTAILIWLNGTQRYQNFKALLKIGVAGGTLVTFCIPIIGSVDSPSSAKLQHARPAKWEERQSRPDIVLITIDALAANHLSIYGYPKPTSPHLEKLAGESDVFDRFYANGNFTTPTINSLLHGVRPWTHRANQASSIVTETISDQGLVPRLKLAGYQTFAVSTNILAAPYLNGTDRLFDQVSYQNIRDIHCFFMSYLGPRFPHATPLSSLFLFSKTSSCIEHSLVLLRFWPLADHYNPEFAFSSAKRLIQSRQSASPMFLWIHLFYPHDPYATPAPFAGQFDSSSHRRTRFDSSPQTQFLAKSDPSFPSSYVGRYDEAIAYVDNSVGSFIAWLKKYKLYENALIVVSADHGESFSHGYGTHKGPMLYEDVIHIPLLIKQPGQTTGNRHSTPAEQIDLMPTILDFAAVPIAEPMEGISLRPVIHGAHQTPSSPIFSMSLEQSSRFGKLHTGVVAMIEGDWKYTHYFGHLDYPQMPKLEDSLFNLKIDSGETVNLVTREPTIAAKMLAMIEQKLRQHGGSTP